MTTNAATDEVAPPDSTPVESPATEVAADVSAAEPTGVQSSAPEPTAPRLSPEPKEEDRTAEPTDEEGDEPEPFDADLPPTLADAHALIVKLRKSYHALTLRDRKRRELKKIAEADVSRLSTEHGKVAAKVEQLTRERNEAVSAREAAETERAAAVEEVGRYREELLNRFKPGQREIAEALPTDKIPAYFEQVNGRALLTTPEPQPTPARHVVTRESAPKRKAEGFNEYFDGKK